MKELILCKYGEIALKGLNKSTFESMLVKNVKRRLRFCGKFNFTRSQSTLYIEPLSDDIDMDEVMDKLTKIFGIAKLCRALMVEKTMDSILNDSMEYLEEALEGADTFKVNAKRADKKFPLKSPEICRELGHKILEQFPHLSVDVHNPDVTVTVEIREDNAFINALKIDGAGGMPIGSSGKAMLLLSGGIDSPVAGYMIAKRGVILEATYFHAPPYTSERAKQKVVDLAKLVANYSGPINLHIVNFTDIQLYIYDQCPHDELTIIMRRYMMRIAQHIAQESGSLGLITGESIGQVASQTMQSLMATNDVCTIPVYRPLIGFDKEDIVDVSKKINTYETSILPFEDCCTIFVAKHPVTKPNLKVIRIHEQNLEENIDALVQKALETDEVIHVSWND